MCVAFHTSLVKLMHALEERGHRNIQVCIRQTDRPPPGGCTKILGPLVASGELNWKTRQKPGFCSLYPFVIFE